MTGTVPEPREIGVKHPLALFRAGAWILTLIVSFAIFAMILVIDWRMQGHDGVAPPAWYTAPAKLMPTHIEGDAARGFCDLVSWVNAAREIDCSKDFPRTGATCFGDASAVFCDNGATIVATICWLCLYFAPLLLASVWRRRAADKRSAAERHKSWQQVFYAGLAGGLMLLTNYRVLDLSHYYIPSCAGGRESCGIDLSLQAPNFIVQAFVGLLLLKQAATLAYGARHDFFQKYESADARPAGR